MQRGMIHKAVVKDRELQSRCPHAPAVVVVIMAIGRKTFVEQTDKGDGSARDVDADKGERSRLFAQAFILRLLRQISNHVGHGRDHAELGMGVARFFKLVEAERSFENRIVVEQNYVALAGSDSEIAIAGKDERLLSINDCEVECSVNSAAEKASIGLAPVKSVVNEYDFRSRLVFAYRRYTRHQIGRASCRERG